jgi:transposase InsO family protein
MCLQPSAYGGDNLVRRGNWSRPAPYSRHLYSRPPILHEAMQEITEYTEIFYNRQRRQKRLDYLSPAAYEQNYFNELRQHRILVPAIDD